MQSTAALRDQAAKLLAADTTTLAQAADANVMVLLKADFAPGENLPFGSLLAADFDGSTPLACGLAAQPEALDPTTGDSRITLKSPVGGWRWQTTGITNLPQTIYGYALMNKNKDAYFGAEKLPVPVTLAAADQVVEFGPVDFTLLAGSIR